jgi:hypothetical protein
MKQPEYIEGLKATRNFEEGMKTLFSVPKDKVVRAEKKQKGKRRGSSRGKSVRKSNASDKG